MSGSLFTLAMARLVLKMLGGELIPYTKFDGLIANRLMDEGIITIVPRGSKRSFRMIDPEGCRIYISQNYTSGMELEDWIEMKNCPDEVSRSEIYSYVQRFSPQLLYAYRSYVSWRTMCAFSLARHFYFHAGLRIFSYS